MLEKFIPLCIRELELSSLPEISIVGQDAIQGSAFGQYDGTIKVVASRRHPMDVMRTLAHELVHWKQNTIGQQLDGSDGSCTENQANALAGVIMRKFGQAHPECFRL